MIRRHWSRRGCAPAIACGSCRPRAAGLRSLRIGPFRVLYVLAGGDRSVRVVAIRHRGRAYTSDPR